MGFTDAVKSCLQQNYAGFQGRAPRSEYWFFGLFYVLLITAVAIVGMLSAGMGGMWAGLILLFLSIFLPALAVSIRRLHDTNASGWWYLVCLIPYVGGLILLVWFCIPGTAGDNRFGPDPLGRIRPAGD